jgi:hypothetical protein
MSIDEKLSSLYVGYIDDLRTFADKYNDKNLHGPLMMSIDKYSNQQIKLMVIGQETFGWDRSLNIECQQKTYTDFDFGSSYKSTPFWNIIRKTESALGIEPYSIAWSNINRFDENQGPPSDSILNELVKFDEILKNEITILKPDVCILFTNHKYDYRLEKLYENLAFENIDSLPEGHFYKLFHPELPKITIRAPHPKTIRLQNWEDKFLEFLAKFA